VGNVRAARNPESGLIVPLIIIAVAAVLTAGGAWFFSMRRGDVSPDEARRLVQSGALLVDVRSREEYGAGHVPGAINLPVQELPRRMAELPRDKPLVLYCRSGHRSGRATDMLRQAGYSGVHNLGAMGRWPGATTATPAP
jgi:rhodanese-related sulfurtransferase